VKNVFAGLALQYNIVLLSAEINPARLTFQRNAFPCPITHDVAAAGRFWNQNDAWQLIAPVKPNRRGLCVLKGVRIVAGAITLGSKRLHVEL
jgi:hypothetical protein